MSRKLGQNPWPLLVAQHPPALELRQDFFDRRLGIACARRRGPRPHAREGLAEAILVERLEQVIDCIEFKGLNRVAVVGRHEHDRRQGGRIERARQFDAIEGIHLDVEKQQLRLTDPDRRDRALAVAVFADDAQIRFLRAVLAQRAAARRLVVDDDDVDHVPSIAKISGMRISTDH